MVAVKGVLWNRGSHPHGSAHGSPPLWVPSSRPGHSLKASSLFSPFRHHQIFQPLRSEASVHLWEESGTPYWCHVSLISGIFWAMFSCLSQAPGRVVGQLWAKAEKERSALNQSPNVSLAWISGPSCLMGLVLKIRSMSALQKGAGWGGRSHVASGSETCTCSGQSKLLALGDVLAT